MRFLLFVLFFLPVITQAQTKPFFNIMGGYESGKIQYGYNVDAGGGIRFNNLFYAGVGGRIGNVSQTKYEHLEFYPIYVKLGVIDNKKTGLAFFVEPGLITKSHHAANQNGGDIKKVTNTGFYYNASAGVKLFKSSKVSPLVTVGYSSYNINIGAGQYNKGFFSARAGIIF